jgi:two-component system sensor histidine kinase YesM
MKSGISKWFNEIHNLRIKAKLFLLITISMAVSSCISLVGLQIAYSIYDQQIYEKSSQVLNLSSTLIENELNKVERLTFSIMSDEQIQQNLIVMNEDESDYNRIQSRAKLVDRLVQYINTETYIIAADITDVKGSSYSSGNLSTLSSERRDLIQTTGSYTVQTLMVDLITATCTGLKVGPGRLVLADVLTAAGYVICVRN